MFRYPKHKYLSNISDSIDRSRMVQQLWSNGEGFEEQSTVGLEDVIKTFFCMKYTIFFRFLGI